MRVWRFRKRLTVSEVLGKRKDSDWEDTPLNRRHWKRVRAGL